MRIRVLKIGGSLLKRPQLLQNLSAWRRSADNTFDVTILIIGGGEMIDAVRAWDSLRPSDPAVVHWRCVEMLRFSFETMRDCLLSNPDWSAVETIESLIQWSQFVDQLPVMKPERDHFVLLNVPAAYNRASHQASPQRLPENWDTTTDSISLWLANLLAKRFARRSVLVQCTLLKSCQPPPNWSLASLVESGVIDPACGLFRESGWPLDVCFLPK